MRERERECVYVESEVGSGIFGISGPAFVLYKVKIEGVIGKELTM